MTLHASIIYRTECRKNEPRKLVAIVLSSGEMVSSADPELDTMHAFVRVLKTIPDRVPKPDLIQMDLSELTFMDQASAEILVQEIRIGIPVKISGPNVEAIKSWTTHKPGHTEAA